MAGALLEGKRIEKAARNEIRKLVLKICSWQKGFLRVRALVLQPEPWVSRDSHPEETCMDPGWGSYDVDSARLWSRNECRVDSKYQHHPSGCTWKTIMLK